MVIGYDVVIVWVENVKGQGRSNINWVGVSCGVCVDVSFEYSRLNILVSEIQTMTRRCPDKPTFGAILVVVVTLSRVLDTNSVRC